MALAELIEEAIHKGETLEGVSTLRKDTGEVKRQPAKAKTTERGKGGRPASQRPKSAVSNFKRSSPAARPDPQAARPSTKGSKPLVSKTRKAPIVRVTKTRASIKPGAQKATKRTGQKVMKVYGKR